MRIGIDFHLAEREGTGNCTYARSLFEALMKAGPENEYILYVANPSLPYYGRFKGQKNVRFHSVYSGNPFVRIPALGLRTFTDNLDLLHVQYTAPPFHRGSLVVTVHDLSFLHYPQCFRKYMRIYLKTMVAASLKRADKILTISEHSRNDILGNYKVPFDKTAVTPLAADSAFRPAADFREVRNILKPYGIGERFILFVGRLDARKNVSLLLQAFAALKKNLNIPHQLVIVGKMERRGFWPASLQQEMLQLSSRDEVICPGYVPPGILPAFYSMADVFVYPSLYEGFGLPVVEAMACGCPVVVSNVSSLPEVVGEAGFLVEPRLPERWASAIQKVICDEALRGEMKRKGIDQARTFDWSRTAELTLKAYRETYR